MRCPGAGAAFLQKMNKESYQKDKVQFHKLIKKIAKKEVNSLEKFYSVYGKLIYATALVITKDKSSADEVVNEVLFKIWQGASKFSKINNPCGWLYTITANCAKDKLKSEKAYTEIYDIDYKSPETENIFAKDEFLYLIAFLSETEQQIMILRFVKDMSFEKIAKEMNKPISTITSTYYRALEKIKNKNFKI